MNTRNSAIQLVVEAFVTPEVWCSDGSHEDEVIFANGIYTVGSNGDVEDFVSADQAAEALAASWDKEDLANLITPL